VSATTASAGLLTGIECQTLHRSARFRGAETDKTHLPGSECTGACEPTRRIPLRAGRYQVVIHIFDDEADALDDSADPTNVLSGFLVLISPEKTPAPTYRVCV
jgi:hypothetical protein